ncbi:N-acetylmuramoyl-L-alanine amidase family protein [Paenibacillus thiaminolyticus]|uniref:N-acetylmuramoyl-L-alanine amidase family protein n=1 Tax=Paenibacillus thiaminolyticus TaxID=49283 RepID=UPI0035A61FA3
MTIEIKQRLLPDGRPNKPNRAMRPQYITIHNTDNLTGTTELHSRYVLNGSGGEQKSWHYTVDEHDIYQHLRDDEQGWHAGDGNGPGDWTSIGIEVCMYQGMDEPKA